MKRIMLFLVAVAASVSVCAQETARIPYDTLVVKWRELEATTEEKIPVIRIKSKNSDVSPEEIRLDLMVSGKKSRLSLTSDGLLPFKPDADLRGKGAIITTNQPRGSLRLEMTVETPSTLSIRDYDGKHYNEFVADYTRAPGTDSVGMRVDKAHEAEVGIRLAHDERGIRLSFADGSHVDYMRDNEAQEFVVVPLKEELREANPLLSVLRTHAEALFCYVSHIQEGDAFQTVYAVTTTEGEIRFAYWRARMTNSSSDGSLELNFAYGPYDLTEQVPQAERGAIDIAASELGCKVQTRDGDSVLYFDVNGEHVKPRNRNPWFRVFSDGAVTGFFPLTEPPSPPTVEELSKRPAATFVQLFKKYSGITFQQDGGANSASASAAAE